MRHLIALLALTVLGAPPAHTQEPWRANFRPDGTPTPLRDPADTRVWPNRSSCANSDDWISRNHDRIRQMRPRVLAINFSNRVDPAKPMKLVNQLLAALKESSRYHGYADPAAPAFLDYSVWRYVDLRDPGVSAGNSSRTPIKPNVKPSDLNFDYGGMFGDRFAEAIGVRDPKNPTRFMRLDELVERGFVHEVVFVINPDGKVGALECVEEKPQYDAAFRKTPGKWVQAGNGGDDLQPWTGRAIRINCLNEERGIGCGMENLAHSFEGLAHSKAIPYFTRYFHEFAGFDLDKRYGLPFDSFYALWGPGKGISYPDDHTAVVTDGEKTWRLENYVAMAGNVHFPPNGRRHYDQQNAEPVLSTIEDWRIGSGPGGKDLAKAWTNSVLRQYEGVAPDCMGKWLVYWRQNVPGWRNRSKDEQGRPMKNWWPFLYY